MAYNIPNPYAISVKDAPFFAKGDGVTDDTAAFSAAFAAKDARGGGTIRIPLGTLTPVGSVTTSDSRATTGAAAWTATIVPTGSAVTVSVTGGTGTVNWNTIAQWRITQ